MASPAPISGLRGVAQPMWAVGAGEWEKAPTEAVVASLHGDTVVGLLSPKQGLAQRGAGGHWQLWRDPVWWQSGTYPGELGRGVTPWLCCVALLRLPRVGSDEQNSLSSYSAVPCPAQGFHPAAPWEFSAVSIPGSVSRDRMAV